MSEEEEEEEVFENASICGCCCFVSPPSVMTLEGGNEFLQDNMRYCVELCGRGVGGW